jgi:hypothetical protein
MMKTIGQPSARSTQTLYLLTYNLALQRGTPVGANARLIGEKNTQIIDNNGT